MGHLITIDSNEQACIQPFHNRCTAIRQTPVPKNPKAVKRLIGAVKYVSNFFPKVQEILRPLHRLGRKRKDFEWTAEHQEAFETIKELMTKPPILHMPKKEVITAHLN
ncbi:hypothetical protein HOLleu_24199 [Holothuria leucospilota]|uniref:Reverse transcriptase/retrotransposon-derived protein RNase H-like domain-containing protein n=1 Tax=Holothuria leucospilota TaxID=206669 RepID=A0A9Q1BVW9_HOLLE|nr:hypothetical protein HOLleu_24199 [Holothuria leucospilota]